MIGDMLKFLRNVFTVDAIEGQALEESFVKIMNMLKR
jgi:hypothetical protein